MICERGGINSLATPALCPSQLPSHRTVKHDRIPAPVGPGLRANPVLRKDRGGQNERIVGTTMPGLRLGKKAQPDEGAIDQGSEALGTRIPLSNVEGAH